MYNRSVFEELHWRISSTGKMTDTQGRCWGLLICIIFMVKNSMHNWKSAKFVVMHAHKFPECIRNCIGETNNSSLLLISRYLDLHAQIIWQNACCELQCMLSRSWRHASPYCTLTYWFWPCDQAYNWKVDGHACTHWSIALLNSMPRGS